MITFLKNAGILLIARKNRFAFLLALCPSIRIKLSLELYNEFKYLVFSFFERAFAFHIIRP